MIYEAPSSSEDEMRYNNRRGGNSRCTNPLIDPLLRQYAIYYT